MSVTGWELDRSEREALLKRFAPAWPNVIADHITLDSQADAEGSLPSTRHADIVGEVNDGAGLQAMVVAIDGTTDRPDGGTYHITWSLDRGRNAFESNAVIARRGWRALEEPVSIEVIPARFG
jgi:hypothetical protein